MNEPLNKPTIRINGEESEYIIENGYARLERNWNEGDKIELDIPLEIKKISAN